ncbi:MAG: dephospho-CoA kinase [Tissierellaceae bacterium]|nr:dephospho-CoA kinase [Tissierellaceae bacterium]
MKHTNCMIIGLTGGIASGKSTVSNILIEKGYKVIDADIISREVVEIGKPAYKDIIDYFGEEILNDDKSLNRKLLGDIVFSNDELLQVLNNIIHPYIFKEIKDQILKECMKVNVLFVDIPLLFERYDEFQKQGIIFDEIWLVYVDEKTQLKRLMLRNNLSQQQATERIKTQIPLEEKKEHATKIIDNNGDLTQLNINVEKLLQEIM